MLLWPNYRSNATTANHTLSLSFLLWGHFSWLIIRDRVWTMNQLEVCGWQKKKRFLTPLLALSRKRRTASLWNVVIRGTSCHLVILALTWTAVTPLPPSSKVGGWPLGLCPSEESPLPLASSKWDYMRDLEREDFMHILAKRVVGARPRPKDQRRGGDLGSARAKFLTVLIVSP